VCYYVWCVGSDFQIQKQAFQTLVNTPLEGLYTKPLARGRRSGGAGYIHDRTIACPHSPRVAAHDPLYLFHRYMLIPGGFLRILPGSSVRTLLIRREYHTEIFIPNRNCTLRRYLLRPHPNLLSPPLYRTLRALLLETFAAVVVQPCATSRSRTHWVTLHFRFAPARLFAKYFTCTALKDQGAEVESYASCCWGSPAGHLLPTCLQPAAPPGC
jgi:hypothetical protein